MQADHAGRRFPIGLPDPSRFDAVIDRIAHQMNQRIDQPFHHTRIDFRAFAGHRHLHVFAGRTGAFPHRPPKPGEQHADRHHPGFGSLVPYAGGQLLQLVHFVPCSLNRSVQLRNRFADVSGPFADPASEDVEIVVFIELQLAEFGHTGQSGHRCRGLLGREGGHRKGVFLLECLDAGEQTVLASHHLVGQLTQGFQSPFQSSSGDDQLADEIQQLLQTIPSDSDLLDVSCRACHVGIRNGRPLLPLRRRSRREFLNRLLHRNRCRRRKGSGNQRLPERRELCPNSQQPFFQSRQLLDISLEQHTHDINRP